LLSLLGVFLQIGRSILRKEPRNSTTKKPE
jgi:hypothetical protein